MDTEQKELTPEELKDIMAEKLAYLFIEQIRMKNRAKKENS